MRTRGAEAVQALLKHGADAGIRNKNGSTTGQLAMRATGRTGSGSAEAKAQQEENLALLGVVIVCRGGAVVAVGGQDHGFVANGHQYNGSVDDVGHPSFAREVPHFVCVGFDKGNDKAVGQESAELGLFRRPA